jgi:hypothetical protein
LAAFVLLVALAIALKVTDSTEIRGSSEVSGAAVG